MSQAIKLTEQFKDNLARLPAVDGLERVDILGAEGGLIASIPNMDGKRGSLAVYYYLYQQFGGLTADAAEQGLAIFAEHVADARANPGKHPNVDLLLAVNEGADPLQIAVIAAA
jgi:hypothetical protein